jgi:hypothetical protein
MKRNLGLFVALAFLTSAASGLAQVTFQYTTQGPATLRQEGYEELLGNSFLSINTSANAGTVGAGSVISFNVPATTNLNPGCGTTGQPACPSTPATVAVTCTTNGTTSCTGSLTVTYTNPQTLSIYFNSSVTFAVKGYVEVNSLRVNAVALGPGATVPLTVSAEAVGAPIFFNTTVQNVGMVSTLPAVTLTGVTTGSELTCLPGQSTLSVNVAENYASALRDVTDEGYTSISNVVGDTLTLTITNVPAGLTLTPGTPTGTGNLVLTTPAAQTQTATGPLSFTYTITGESEGLQENATLPFTLLASGPLPANIPPSVATVVLGPVTSTPPVSSIIPAFDGVNEPGSPTVANYSDCVTDILLPYISTYNGGGSAPDSHYDTGVTISNTTNDPFTPGAGGATPQTGSCTLTLYPNSGAPSTSWTSGSVAPGGQLQETLSGLGAPWAGVTGGYVVAICNFQNAHAFVSVYDNAGLGSPGFQQGYLGLVIPNPGIHPRNPASPPTCNAGSVGCQGSGEQLGN